MLSDYRLLSYNAPLQERAKEIKPKRMPNTRAGRYVFKNTVKLISINGDAVEEYLGIHNLCDYKLQKVRQSLEAIIPIDLEALGFREVPAECISL